MLMSPDKVFSDLTIYCFLSLGSGSFLPISLIKHNSKGSLPVSQRTLSSYLPSSFFPVLHTLGEGRLEAPDRQLPFCPTLKPPKYG